MFRMRSSNAAISNLSRQASSDVANRASYKGVTAKGIYFASIAIISSIVFAVLCMQQATQEFALTIIVPASLLAFIFALVSIFFPSSTPFFGSIYCVLQGAVMGSISALIDIYFPGVALMAILSTVGVFVLMLVLYSTGVIKVGKFMQSVIMSALLGLILFGFVAYIISIFSVSARQAFYGDSILALIVAAISVVVASFVILLDLKQIDSIVKLGLDKKYEWSAAFGLIITLIWLYMEMLRLFMIISSRSRK